jgi:hypothetical protein
LGHPNNQITKYLVIRLGHPNNQIFGYLGHPNNQIWWFVFFWFCSDHPENWGASLKTEFSKSVPLSIRLFQN